jgi:hypothetical protein
MLISAFFQFALLFVPLTVGLVLSIVTFGINVTLELLFHTLSATALAALVTVNAPFNVTQFNTNLYTLTPLLVLCHVNVFVLGFALVPHTLKLKSPIVKSHVVIHAHVSVTFRYTVISVALFAKLGLPFPLNAIVGFLLSTINALKALKCMFHILCNPSVALTVKYCLHSWLVICDIVTHVVFTVRDPIGLK